jgi:hypothetical protein
MSPLDEYRSALLIADPEVAVSELMSVLDNGGERFVSVVIEHGLGPVWHQRTGREEFHESRRRAEVLFVAQEKALQEIDRTLNEAGIEYTVIKGTANRLVLYENPALRVCFDADILVHPTDRIRAAKALKNIGFQPRPYPRTIGHQVVLSRSDLDIDLHWRLLRDGRLREEDTAEILGRRVRTHGIWMLSAEDTLYLFLVHPAFAKHLAARNLGLHRVLDILHFLRAEAADWTRVKVRLKSNGVTTAAWATLSWVALLAPNKLRPGLDSLLSDLRPGPLRRAWIELWLKNNWSQKTEDMHWLRLAAFSPLLHDSTGDIWRALSGRLRALRRTSSDLEAFEQISG